MIMYILFNLEKIDFFNLFYVRIVTKKRDNNNTDK